VGSHRARRDGMLFRSGRSQAVRPSNDFRFRGRDARIQRHGGAFILEPAAGDWRWLDDIAGLLDTDFVLTFSVGS
jgi:virulence-associated protein VagC